MILVVLLLCVGCNDNDNDIVEPEFNVYTAMDDENFIKVCKATIGGKDVLTIAEAAAVVRLNAHNRNITSLKGIEYFTGLKVLYCSHNQLQTIDISKNTNLLELYCSDNQLQTIDLSANFKLRDLVCSFNQLQTLDVSKNTMLYYLSCYYNQLETLDVSKNTELISLLCSNNKLEVLDISNNTKLNQLSAKANLFTEITVWKGFEVEKFYDISVDPGVTFKEKE